jgi:hypothetical protein
MSSVRKRFGCRSRDSLNFAALLDHLARKPVDQIPRRLQVALAE